MIDFSALQNALQRAVVESRAPGAVGAVGGAGLTPFLGAAGLRQRAGGSLPAERDTIYDLASLTKVLATTTALLHLRDAGRLDLDWPVARVIPIPGLERFTLRHCLTHTSGLPATGFWFKELNSVDGYVARIAAEPLRTPPGAARRYSDLGFILLGRVVELIAQDTLEAYCAKQFYVPLGMRDTGFRPPATLRPRVAPTEQCPWRGKLLQGEVHDENAYAMGGVSGHAGLFSTAGDIGIFCDALLAGKILAPATVAEMTRQNHLPFYPWQGLGWQLDPWRRSSGFLPARSAFGHTGWTGTCLWLDARHHRWLVLLSNTAHPSRSGRDNETLRLTFCEAAAAALYPRQTNTHTGIDRLLWSEEGDLEGRRVALLTNTAARDVIGRPSHEAIRFVPGLRLARLYSPEHGFSGQAEAGAKVGAQSAAVPITSLYGQQKAPTPEELRGVDRFVIDLPDIGARYYTYMATMQACLAACASARVPVVVLDRPNPLGGQILEGPVAQRTDSLICSAAVPARHGMTLGELAEWFRQRDPACARVSLSVQRLDAWTPERLFGECSMEWVPPSPNIPDAETALLYAGMCLFEGTNLNEGRGTDEPFRVFGAPWVEPEALLGALSPGDHPGIRFEVADYLPRRIPGKAESPVHLGARCRGLRLLLLDARAARPFTTAMALLRALRQRYPQEFAWRADHFDLLAGDYGALRQALDAGAAPAELEAGWAAARARYDALRPRFYG